MFCSRRWRTHGLICKEIPLYHSIGDCCFVADRNNLVWNYSASSRLDLTGKRNIHQSPPLAINASLQTNIPKASHFVQCRLSFHYVTGRK